MRALLAGVVSALTVTGAAAAGSQPIMFTEGPFMWDDDYAAGSLCDFPVRVTGGITAEQTWFVSGFPPAPDESWRTLTRFAGSETWTNLSNGTAATDDFRYTIQHEFHGFFELLRTVQTGTSTNVKGGTLVEAGRSVWVGEDLSLPTEWNGRFIQFPDFGTWIEARCGTIA